MWHNHHCCLSSCGRRPLACFDPQSHNLQGKWVSKYKRGFFTISIFSLESNDVGSQITAQRNNLCCSVSHLHTGQHESGGMNCSWGGQVSGGQICCKQVHVRSFVRDTDKIDFTVWEYAWVSELTASSKSLIENQPFPLNLGPRYSENTSFSEWVRFAGDCYTTKPDQRGVVQFLHPALHHVPCMTLSQSIHVFGHLLT